MLDTLSPRWRLLRGSGYLTLFLAAYLVALWQLLPYEELGHRGAMALRPQGIGAEVQGLGPGGVLSWQADEVTLFPVEQPEWRWPLTELTVRLLPQRLLRGERAATVQATTLGGQLETTAVWQQHPHIAAQWQELQLAQLPLPPAAAGLVLTGQVSGTLQATADPANPVRTEAELTAALRDVAIAASTLQGFPIPAVRLGDGTVRLRAANGKLEIETAEFIHGDLEIHFTGSIILRDDLPRSLINGTLSLLPNEQAAKDLALVFALFPGPKGSDGRYAARLRGSLGAPRLLKR